MGAEAEASAFTIRLLGAVDVRSDGQPIPTLRTRAGMWVLVLLVLRHPRPVEREWLAGTLWPDSIPEQGLANLRQRLSELRRALGREACRLLAPSTRTLSLDLEGADVDLLEFDSALTRGDALSLRKAVALYRGELVEGCSDEWVLAERRARESGLLTALERLAEQAVSEGEPGAAASYLRRVVAIEPMRESAQRALMKALADDGDYAAATLAYGALRQYLYREQRADPDPETVALFHRLREQARRFSPRRSIPGMDVKPASAPMTAAADPPSDSLPTNLPVQATSFVGREAEMAEVTRLLACTRLLTLTGAGGCGKTRLSLEMGAGLLADYPDGVWLVELAALTDPVQAPRVVATSLGITEQPDRPPLQSVTDHLRSRSLLLILDNCEHLLDACAALVDALLRSCPKLKILATSREALRVSGEQAWRVPSLLPPDPDRLPNEEKELAGIVGEYDAVRLFVERATSHRSDFRLTNANARIVASICHRLDGIPLALELAAARVRALPLEQLAVRLDDRFRLLTGGVRTALPRQQTLRALIDWSYNLLNAEERLLLDRLSVFAGGWTLSAAETVCGDFGDVFDLLTSVVDKSLVVYVEQEGQERYRLLETIHQYARDRLLERGKEEIVRARHRDYFLSLALEAKPQGSDALYWLDRLETEHDNLRAALGWALRDPQGVENALRPLKALGNFWRIRGYCREGYAWTQAFLNAEGAGRTQSRAQVLVQAANADLLMGNVARAREEMEESVAICREKGGLYFALFNYGDFLNNIGDFAAARVVLEEGLMIAHATGGSGGGMRANLGVTHFYLGAYAEARRLITEDLALNQELGYQEYQSELHSFLGRISLALSDFETARFHLTASISLGRDLEFKDGILRSLFGFAGLAAASGQAVRATRLYGASQGLHDLQGSRLTVADEPEYRHQTAALHIALGEDAYADAFTAGCAMNWEQSIEYALSNTGCRNRETRPTPE